MMKRTIQILCCVFFSFMALYPLGDWILLGFGYTLILFSVPAIAIVVAALSVCLAVLAIIYKDTISNKTIRALVVFITPLSLINTFFYLLESEQISIIVSGAICFVCSCILTLKYAKPMALKIVALILSALMTIPVGLLSLVVVFFPIGQNTVVQTVESPSGKYYAEVIDSDQGALGGDTLVDVYENWEKNLLLFKIEKKPKRVYFGDWGEFETMRIKWRDDSCLVINSVEYKIE